MTTSYVLRYPLLYAPVDTESSNAEMLNIMQTSTSFICSIGHPLNRCLGDGSQPHSYTNVHTGHPMQQQYLIHNLSHIKWTLHAAHQNH